MEEKTIIEGNFILDAKSKMTKSGKFIKNLSTGKAEYLISPLLDYKNAYYKDGNGKKTLFLTQQDHSKRINQDELMELFRVARKYALDNGYNLIVDSYIRLTEAHMTFVNNVVVGDSVMPMTHKEMKFVDNEYNIKTIGENFLNRYQYNTSNGIYQNGSNEIVLKDKCEKIVIPEDVKVKIITEGKHEVVKIEGVNEEGKKNFDLSNVTFTSNNDDSPSCSVQPTDGLCVVKYPVVAKLPKVDNSLDEFSFCLSSITMSINKPIMPTLKECNEFIENPTKTRKINVDEDLVEEQSDFVKMVDNLRKNNENISEYIEIQSSLEDEYEKLGYDFHDNMNTISKLSKLPNRYNEEIVETARKLTAKNSFNHDIK